MGRIPCQTLCGYFMALEGKRISELTEVSRVNKSSKLPIDTGGEEALSITLENLMESGVNAAIEALQFITWVDVLPPTGSTKYLYVVPREEVDKDGNKIAALYLWDGSAWRGAGAFSLNIDPVTLATKDELDTGLATKQNNLTTSQLEAVNSGITSDLVAQISASTTIAVNSITDTSGTVSLADNKCYAMTVLDATTFTLPTVSDTATHHQIKLFLSVTGTPTINWGTNNYFNKTAPEIAEGNYIVYFDYNPNLSTWTVGAMTVGGAE